MPDIVSRKTLTFNQHSGFTNRWLVMMVLASRNLARGILCFILTKCFLYVSSNFMYLMQYSQTHSLFCFPYSSGKGEKYQASISYLPNWILSTYFILVIFRRHKNQTNKTGALINLCCILESYSLFNLFSTVENFMCWSLKEPSKGFCMAKRFCLKLCPFNYVWY